MKKTLLFILLLITVIVAISCGGGKTEVTDTSGNTSEALTEAPAEDLKGEKIMLENGAVYSIVNDAYYGIGGETFGTVLGEFADMRGFRGDLDQLFRALDNGDGTYKLENLSSGLYLSVRAATSRDNAKTLLTVDTDVHAQDWTVYKEGEKYYLRCAETGTWLANEKPDDFCKPIMRTEQSDATLWNLKKQADKDTVFPRILRLDGDYVSASSCPEIIKHNGVYYNFNQSGGIVVKKSTDLINWTKIGSVFNTKPAWIKAEIGSDSIWAPGCYKVGDKWRVYYAASSLGSQNSVIGMALAETPEGPYTDCGMVIRSYKGDPYNCIDPCVFTDDDGQTYFIWGSYWTGIYMRRLDKETGLLLEGSSEQWHLAQGTGQMEAPYLIKKDGYYYLFVAMGNLSKNESYHWTVGRSESLFGPYVDKNGKPMLENNSSRLTAYKPGVQGLAHAHPFLDDDGQWYMVGECWLDRTDPNRKVQLHISTIVWNEEGWPVTALSTDLIDELNGKN
ncbi:MAG: family 43 glycosylhydrolase [Clostridia bacterium]|nr:family 43 glycosylhydrolase [Clostridia bacterium]